MLITWPRSSAALPLRDGGTTRSPRPASCRLRSPGSVLPSGGTPSATSQTSSERGFRVPTRASASGTADTLAAYHAGMHAYREQDEARARFLLERYGEDA